MVNDNAMGDPNAPIKIEEFSDYQCPYCARFYEETEGQIVDTYVANGTVYFVYRSFGNFIGPNPRRRLKQRTALVTRINSGNFMIFCMPMKPAKTWALLQTVV